MAPPNPPTNPTPTADHSPTPTLASGVCLVCPGPTCKMAATSRCTVRWEMMSPCTSLTLESSLSTRTSKAAPRRARTSAMSRMVTSTATGPTALAPLVVARSVLLATLTLSTSKSWAGEAEASRWPSLGSTTLPTTLGRAKLRPCPSEVARTMVPTTPSMLLPPRASCWLLQLATADDRRAPFLPPLRKGLSLLVLRTTATLARASPTSEPA
mmetsp:Transcript_25216/g.27953  ORF Transcript_25216/g.27953 Transcript_25216/m.27953 type:complete len:212 (+) Transcript_25216:292-927(+)